MTTRSIIVYNHSHPAVGKPVMGKDLLLFKIPPIGEYAEIKIPESVEDPDKVFGNYYEAAKNIVANSFGRFSFNQPMAKVLEKENKVIDSLQEEREKLAAENELLKQQLAALTTAVEDAPKTTSKKVTKKEVNLEDGSDQTETR